MWTPGRDCLAASDRLAPSGRLAVRCLSDAPSPPAASPGPLPPGQSFKFAHHSIQSRQRWYIF